MLGSLRSSNGNRQGGLSRKSAANAGASWRERGGWRAYAKSGQRHKRDGRIAWSCPPVLCAGRGRVRASGGRKKLKGATLTCSRVAPSDREGPGWVPGWRLELADHLVVVRSWLLHEPDLGLAKDDGARDWRGTRQPGESAVSVRARIIHVAVR